MEVIINQVVTRQKYPFLKVVFDRMGGIIASNLHRELDAEYVLGKLLPTNLLSIIDSLSGVADKQMNAISQYDDTA